MGETVKATHTPGTWIAVKADLHGDNESYDRDRWAVCVGDDDEQYFIATVENGVPGDTLETEEANARLMAAAPDLLEAAQTVLAGLNARIEDAGYKCQPVPVYDGIADLHTAINKATGEK